MLEDDFQRRLVKAIERIADALEVSNRADPLLAIQAALETGNFDETQKLPVPEAGPDDDMPEHIRRLLAR